MVTTDPIQVRMITSIQATLRRKAVVVSTDTIELIIAAYEKRKEELV